MRLAIEQGLSIFQLAQSKRLARRLA